MDFICLQCNKKKSLNTFKVKIDGIYDNKNQPVKCCGKFMKYQKKYGIPQINMFGSLSRSERISKLQERSKDQSISSNRRDMEFKRHLDETPPFS